MACHRGGWPNGLKHQLGLHPQTSIGYGILKPSFTSSGEQGAIEKGSAVGAVRAIVIVGTGCAGLAVGLIGQNEMASVRATVRHRIYCQGVLYLELLDVAWYDNASAYRGCVRDLQALYELAATAALTIVSDDELYTIPDQAAFRQWVAQVFEQYQSWGMYERLR